jgi:hypothetical protein
LRSETQKTERDLTPYMVALKRAQDVRGDAQTLLNTHPGFASNGDVINSAVAAKTLSSLDFFLSNSQFWLTQANLHFSQAQRIAR